MGAWWCRLAASSSPSGSGPGADSAGAGSSRPSSCPENGACGCCSVPRPATGSAPGSFPANAPWGGSSVPQPATGAVSGPFPVNGACGCCAVPGSTGGSVVESCSENGASTAEASPVRGPESARGSGAGVGSGVSSGIAAAGRPGAGSETGAASGAVSGWGSGVPSLGTSSHTQNCHPSGAGGHVGSGCHPSGGDHPSGGCGQPGAGLKRYAMVSPLRLPLVARANSSMKRGDLTLSDHAREGHENAQVSALSAENHPTRWSHRTGTPAPAYRKGSSSSSHDCPSARSNSWRRRAGSATCAMAARIRSSGTTTFP